MDTDIERINSIVDEIMKAKAGAAAKTAKPADIEENKNVKGRTGLICSCSHVELKDKRQRYILISVLEAYKDGIITPNDAICFKGTPSGIFGLSLGHNKSQLKLKGSVWFVMLSPKDGIKTDEGDQVILYGNDYLDIALSFLFYAQNKDVSVHDHDAKMEELRKTNYIRIKTKSGKNVTTSMNLWHLFNYQDKNSKPKIQEYINGLRNDAETIATVESKPALMEVEVPVKPVAVEPVAATKESTKRKPEAEPEQVESELPASPPKKQKSKEPVITEPTEPMTVEPITTTNEGIKQSTITTTDYDTFVRNGIGAAFYGSYLDGAGRLSPKETTELRGTVNESFGFEMVKNDFLNNITRKEEYQKEAKNLETGDWRTLCSLIRKAITQEKDDDNAIITKMTVEKEKLAKQLKQTQEENKKFAETIEKMTLDASLEKEKVEKLEKMEIDHERTVKVLEEVNGSLQTEVSRLETGLARAEEMYRRELANIDALRVELSTATSEKQHLESVVQQQKEEIATTPKMNNFALISSTAETLPTYLDALRDVSKGVEEVYRIFSDTFKSRQQQ